MRTETINIQGHRGARGLYPENTITAFIEAVKLGVKILELDLVISADEQVVVSHEAWMNEAFCSKPDGTPVEADSREKYNLYEMTYAEIRAYDCGKRRNPEFPLQKAMPEYKPLLSEVILKIDEFSNRNNFKPVSYNIEIKTEADAVIFNPPPAVFIDLVYNEIIKYNLTGRVNIQSFDVSMLQQMRKTGPNIKTGLLVENNDSINANLERLGFIPDVYSPGFTLVNELLVKHAHQKNMKLITWTVNEIEQMKRLILMGVDGIITDYPDRAFDFIKNNN